MDEFIDMNSKKLIEITQEILKVKSVEGEPTPLAPFGEGVRDALMKALEISENLGFSAVNLDNVLGYAEYGKGSEVISVLGHVDIVPEGKGWIYPPYGAEIHDGKLYGRGSIDDKGPTMASLFGLYAIKEMGLPLQKKVRIIFGTNEETGWKCMEYLKKKIKDKLIGFAPDGKFPVINREKGILNFVLRREFTNKNLEVEIKGGERPNMVPDYAEAVFKREVKENFDISNISVDGSKIIAKGVSAHGSLPERGKNAIILLADALKKLEIEGEAKLVIDFINNYIGFDVNGKGLNIDFEDSYSGKLTANLGMIHVNQDFAELTFNIRYPISFKHEDIIEEVQKIAGKEGFKVINIRNQNPLFVDENSELVKKLLKVYKEQTGKEPFTLSIGGGTYARAMNEGVAFGPTLIGQEEVEHMANEYIATDHLILLAKIYGKAIYELAK